MNVQYSPKAEKQLSKLERHEQQKIVSYMRKISKLKDPKTKGKALVGNLKGVWRYRVGDYRILSRIFESKMQILVIKIGHRKDVYLN